MPYTVYLFDKIVGKSKIYLRKDHVKYSASLHALTDIAHVHQFYTFEIFIKLFFPPAHRKCRSNMKRYK